MQRHAVSDIYTTDHNRLPSVDCDTFGLTANVSGIKVYPLTKVCARYFESSDAGKSLVEEWNYGDMVENNHRSS
jgi:hypothetical protein